MRFVICGIFCLLFVGLPFAVLAQEDLAPTSGLPVPRFVSLKSDKVFVRSGPGKRYPIKWVFNKDGYPVEVIQEFDNWRKIRDIEGQEGWIHHTLLSGRRRGLVQNTEGDDPVFLQRKPQTDSQIMAKIESGVILSLEKCSGNWCLAGVDGFRGWIERKFIWGVYPSEELE